MAANVVEILVKGTNDTKGAFGEAKTGADEVAEAMDAYATAADRAAEAAADLEAKSARLAELQADEKADAGELAAAQDAYATALDRASSATIASIDAQERLAAADARAAEASRGASDAQVAAGAKAAESGGLLAGMGGKVKMAMLGVAVGMGLAVKGAADFQDQTTHLVTDAGESASKLAMVQQGILAVSAATGTSAKEITDAMYHVESAGFHGAQGLAVLKVAAQGAKVGGAELDTVGKALTGTMNAYGMSSKNAGEQTHLSVSMMNQLIAAVGAGDMKMQDLASSLGNVAPVAAAAKISFSQVGGAIATMTAQNMSAQQATQDLRHTILAMESPNKVAQGEMAKLGLSAADLSSNLGKRGLAATLEMVTDAAKKHAGALGQTYTQAVYKAMGGTTGLSTALMLTGSRMETFKGNISTVAAAAAKGGDSVDNWGKIQGTLAFKTDQAKASLQDMGITLGMALLPAVTAVLGPVSHMLSLIAGNKIAAEAFAVVVGGVLAGAIGVKAVGALSGMKEGLKGAADGTQWLIGKIVAMTAATEAQAAATEAETAAQEAADVAMDANPIGLIIMAIVALIAIVVLLATHWKTVWHDVTAVADVAGHVISAVARDIARAFEVAFDWVKGHWPLILAILTGPIGLAVLFISGHWHQITAGASEMMHDVIGFFENLGERVVSIVMGLDQALFNAGARIVSFLANGIKSAIGDVTGAVSSVVDEVKSFLPFSPAKKGPLSGSGAPDRSGASIARMFAQGIMGGRGDVTRAMDHLTGSAGLSGRSLGPAGGYGGYGAGGGQLEVVFRYERSGDKIVDDLFDAFKVEIRSKGGGGPQSVQRALGRTW